MSKIRKIDRMNFKIFSLAILFLSFADAYFLLKYEHFSQLFWFCNTALFLLAFGLFFRKSIAITGIFLGALVVQIPWVIDFLSQLLFNYKLFGVASYMFEYGFDSIRFYIELDHLLIIPLSLYAIKRLGFHKQGWVFAAIVAILINAGAFASSSQLDNVNCVFYSCFSDKITISKYPLFHMILWTFLIIALIYILNKLLIKYPIKNLSSK